ncbi:unnamed protein product, partial [Cuscuta europaea]
MHHTDFCPKLPEEYHEQIDDVGFKRKIPHMRYDPFSNMPMEDMVRALTNNMTTMQNNMVQFQNETKSSILNLETQVSQMVRAVSRLETRDSGKLPFQIEHDSEQEAFAITLKNEKEL